MMPRLRSLALRSLLLAGAFAALAAVDAQASTSTNWSGYVAHGPKFRTVGALWTEPTLTCAPDTQSYSALWVGIGGYSLRSKALEQIGSEADCAASGREVTSAWYELVPAPSRTIRMTVSAGDVMAGKVQVIGSKVTLTLTDRTAGESFTRTITDHTLDVTSADWILEAPSECGVDGSECQPLTLADFGTDAFARARAQTTLGQSEPIDGGPWQVADITLTPGQGQRRFAGNADVANGQSTPSPLTDGGTAFSLTYAPIAPPATPLPQPTAGP